MSSLTDSLANFDHGGFYAPSTDQLEFFCMIPKNASSWISDVLRHNGWVSSTVEKCYSHDAAWQDKLTQYQENPIIDNLIVILRDPVERWVAGIAQYVSTSILNSHWYDRNKFSYGYTGDYIDYKTNYLGNILSGEDFINNYSDVVERLLFGQIAFDDHTQPQIWFVDYFKSYAKNYTWFYVNDHLEETFFSHYPNLTQPVDPDYNKGDMNPDVKIITDFLRQQIKQKPYLKNNLLRFYAQDIDLISQADFVYHDTKN
jgi:hypothetical protein